MPEVSHVSAVTDATFDDIVVRAKGIVAVKFTAEWCGPCRMIAPAVQALAQEYGSRITIVELDTDTSPATMVRFGVRGIPTILIFRDGVVVDRIIGAQQKAVLRERIDRVLAA
jgi:thioredoxin 1